MIAIFSRRYNNVLLVTEGVQGYGVLRQFDASNNAASNSRGPWPPGAYMVDKTRGLIEVTGERGAPEGPFGRWFLPFVVPDRDGEGPVVGPGVGMGLHAGRVNRPDGVGRSGYMHATMGCIRTTPECMDMIAALWPTDPLRELWVR